jgi:hypothetical protein
VDADVTTEPRGAGAVDHRRAAQAEIDHADTPAC